MGLVEDLVYRMDLVRYAFQNVEAVIRSHIEEDVKNYIVRYGSERWYRFQGTMR